MSSEKKERIDKWLFAMRLFKTRSLASEYCDKERVAVGDQLAKPSRLIKPGDVITIFRTGYKQEYEVLMLSDRRLSAKMVMGYYKEITSPEDLEKISVLKAQKNQMRARGTGRPTKRERRDLDDFTEW